MHFIINNPYRILGLTANASSREVAKRVADLETFAEFGKTKKYPLDLVEIVPLIRTVDTIQQAAKDIENDTDKLVYAFFWFAKVDSVDELAIECIENNQVQKAFEIWDQQISKNENDAKFSWRLNRAIISLFWCQGSNFDTDNFESALKDLGYLTDEHFQDVQRFVFGKSNLKIDIEQVNKKIIDETLKFVSNLEEQPYGAYGIGLLHEFWKFSTSAQDYVQTKLFVPYINQIETAIQKSQQLRDAENSSSINQYNGLKEVEDLIYEIDEFSENYRIQSIINEYANEVRICSLYANNKLDNRDLAYDLITWAEQLPSYGHVAEEVKVNKEQLINLIENDKFSENYSSIAEYMERDINSIEDARKFLNIFKQELKQIGLHDDMYYKVSSYCVTKILNFLIDEFNDAHNRLENHQDIAYFLNVAKPVCSLIEIMRTFELVPEVEDRVERNYKNIKEQIEEFENIINKFAQTPNSHQYEPSSYQEPGFYKSDKDIVLSGALGGLAELWGWNAGFLRIFFVVVSLFTSIWPGVIIYIVLNMIMPKRN